MAILSHFIYKILGGIKHMIKERLLEEMSGSLEGVQEGDVILIEQAHADAIYSLIRKKMKSEKGEKFSVTTVFGDFVVVADAKKDSSNIYLEISKDFKKYCKGEVSLLDFTNRDFIAEFTEILLKDALTLDEAMAIAVLGMLGEAVAAVGMEHAAPGKVYSLDVARIGTFRFTTNDTDEVEVKFEASEPLKQEVKNYGN